MAAVTISSDFGGQENEICHCFHFFSIYLPWSTEIDAVFLVFWMLSLSQLFHSPLSSLSRDSGSSSLSAIRMVLSAYLRLLFLPAILIPACDSSILAFFMMYSAYKLNKQGDNVHSWPTPLQILNQSVVYMSGSNCCFLAYRQVSQEINMVVWYSHLFMIFPQFVVIHTVKGLSKVS